MPTSPARTADDIADNIRTIIDRVVEARFTQEMAKRGAEIGDIANDAWKESAGFRRDTARNVERAAKDASKWSDRTWRRSIRPVLRDFFKQQRTVAAGAAAVAVPAGRELVDEAAVRMGLKRREERHWGAFFLGLLIGAAAGAIVAMLTTPKRGDEMRRELGARADEVRREVEHRTDEIATKARDEWVPMFQRPEENGHGTDATDAIAETGEAVQEAAAEAGSTGVETVEGAAEQTAETVGDALEPADQDRPG
jgi:gas vesicle protein